MVPNNMLTVRSPAKINLYLRIMGRYPNGYHKLYTLFHRISLSDTLKISKQKKGITLRSSNPYLPTDERNLVVRAYHLLQQKIPTLGGVSVSIEKRIPLGAGLGGGSSNAAFFLLGMKKLFGLKISQGQLIAMGRQLGADIPFFLENVNQAIGTGRGDVLRRKIVTRKQHFILITSTKELSTKQVYQSLPKHLPAASLTKVSRAVTLIYNFLQKGNTKDLASYLCNDLELPAFHLRPHLKKIIRDLQQVGLQAVRMSGSGPTVFGISSSLSEAKQIIRKLKRSPYQKQVLLCHTY